MEELTLEIATPKGLFVGTFSKTTKVEEVISTVITEKGLDGADSLELIHNGNVLEPVQRPLVSFGLEGTVQLELVATGSGV
ncbi:hypothetical protein MYX84_00270 [Acidobacteria bacterium AH-259-O06]|nr:hypothetical protein [Acidobacteria bacterium AH-259-O06]